MSFLPGRLRADHARERWSNDYYVEPVECVNRLFEEVAFEGVIHDPCCGGGNIPRVAIAYGYKATGSDLVDRGSTACGIRDFFEDWAPRENIVSNPPYKLVEQFVHHALAVTRRKVAIVMRLSFLAGQKRRKNLYRRWPPNEVVILSKRLSMSPGGTHIPAKGGAAEYCWICWSGDYVGPTIMRWA